MTLSILLLVCAGEFTLRKSGDWALTLEMADGRPLTSVVTVTESPFVLVVR